MMSTPIQWGVFAACCLGFWLWFLRKPIQQWLRRSESKATPTRCCDCRRNFGTFPRRANQTFDARAVCGRCYLRAVQRRTELASAVTESKERYELRLGRGLVQRPIETKDRD